jgi:hypothetical protein
MSLSPGVDAIPDQTAHYHILALHAWGFILTRHLTGYKGQEVWLLSRKNPKAGGNCIMTNLVFFISSPNVISDKCGGNAMHGSCSTNGREKTYNFLTGKPEGKWRL